MVRLGLGLNAVDHKRRLLRGVAQPFFGQFSDNVTSFTWRLVTQVGVNANCRGESGGYLGDLLSHERSI